MEKIVVVRRDATPEAVCMAMDALSRKVLELGEETDRLRTENEWLRANAKQSAHSKHSPQKNRKPSLKSEPKACASREHGVFAPFATLREHTRDAVPAWLHALVSDKSDVGRV